MDRLSADSTETGNQQRTNSSRWGISTWFNGLADYVRPKSRSSTSVRGGSEHAQNDRQFEHNSSVSLADGVGDLTFRSGNTSNIFAVSVVSAHDSNTDLTKNQPSFQSVNSNRGSLHRRKTFSSADNCVNASMPHQRTPLVRRFKRDSLISSPSSQIRERSHLAESVYPTSQTQYIGVGILPSVKLAQSTNSPRNAVLGSHNSLMVGSSAIRVKIAPPDAARSPMSCLAISNTEERQSSPDALSHTVVDALRDRGRKRLLHDNVATDPLDVQQNKRRRPNCDVIGVKAMDCSSADDNASQLDTISVSTLSDRGSSSGNHSRSGHGPLQFGARNPIDVSYMSSSYLSKQGQSNLSRANASPCNSLPISRDSSICGSFTGSSRIQLCDDGRLSVGTSESPLPSAPSSGRNTPVTTGDSSSKFGRSTPVPSIEVGRQDGTPDKHRQLLLVKEGSSKRRLVPLSSEIARSFRQSLRQRNSLTAKDLEYDRQLDMERARQMLQTVAGAGSQQFDRDATKGNLLSSTASTTAAADDRSVTVTAVVSVATSTQSFPPTFKPSAATVSTMGNAVLSSANMVNVPLLISSNTKDTQTQSTVSVANGVTSTEKNAVTATAVATSSGSQVPTLSTNVGPVVGSLDVTASAASSVTISSTLSGNTSLFAIASSQPVATTSAQIPVVGSIKQPSLQLFGSNSPVVSVVGAKTLLPEGGQPSSQGFGAVSSLTLPAPAPAQPVVSHVQQTSVTTSVTGQKVPATTSQFLFNSAASSQSNTANAGTTLQAGTLFGDSTGKSIQSTGIRFNAETKSAVGLGQSVVSTSASLFSNQASTPVFGSSGTTPSFTASTQPPAVTAAAKSGSQFTFTPAFGNASSTTTSFGANFSQPLNAAGKSDGQIPSFSFGSAPLSAATLPTSQASQPSLPNAFGNPSLSSLPSYANSKTQPSTAAFGNTVGQTSLVTLGKPAQSVFAFGGSNATTTTTQSQAGFGLQTKPAQFNQVFGSSLPSAASTNTTSQSQTPLGFGAASSAAAGGFSSKGTSGIFGSAAPASANGPFGMSTATVNGGAASQTSSPFIFGATDKSQNTAVANGFSFSGTTQPYTAATGFSTATPAFTFGQGGSGDAFQFGLKTGGTVPQFGSTNNLPSMQFGVPAMPGTAAGLFAGALSPAAAAGGGFTIGASGNKAPVVSTTATAARRSALRRGIRR